MGQWRSSQRESFYNKNRDRARLLISCPDQPGIVAVVSRFLHEQGANIVQSDQYSTDPKGGLFFMRIAFDLPELNEKEKELEAAFAGIADTFDMRWRFAYAYRLKKMAVFVSRQEHCLLELLWQWRAGDLMADPALVISNHEDLRETVESFDIPFHHIPITKERKEEAEDQQMALLDEYRIDVSILARYMQILSSRFVAYQPHRIINIHHSFLPAFVGGRPYERAYERGVKLIGATSHYVTDDLDEGPIIEQDVQRVNHRHNVEDLKRFGRNIERTVLARAVTWHLEDRILVHGNKTIVFSD